MNRDFKDMREQYGEELLDENSVSDNPFELFEYWFQAVKTSEIKEPNAMVLATVDEDLQPDARVVLLKEIADGGFVFYTNFSSAKGNQLDINNKASLVFAWVDLQRQVRVKGVVSKYDDKKSEEYFQSRPKMSQVAAWASPQSKVIPGRDTIERLYNEYDTMFTEHDVLPKPPLWGGYILQPISIEFWQGRRNRLHDRVRYVKNINGWTKERLAP